VGFGRCSICLGDEDGGIKYLQRKRRLKRRKISHKNAVVSEKYKKNNKIANNNNYFAVKLVADAKLDFKGPTERNLILADTWI